MTLWLTIVLIVFALFLDKYTKVMKEQDRKKIIFFAIGFIIIGRLLSLYIINW